MTLPSGSQLGPYRIVNQLGAGGMGVVYQAHDPRLDRHVAIKLLPPDLTRDEIAKQRFLQEAKAASALDHPNICTIHEINETDDGQLYLVMAHYEGETLKDRISKGPLPLNDAIDIATQVGEGLAKAHAAGIVHRDIKPANLMVTADGTIKILDFGLAKLAGTEGVTQTGTTVGTVAYMSPEQAKGQEVDHRTDIWSLGVVLYEMLAGTPPFQGENLLSLSNAILDGEPMALSGASSSAHSVVTKALSKNQTQRYQAVVDLLTELRALQRGSGAATVATPTHADLPSIAVLPFANMSADLEQEYFCDGMAEEIINALTSLEGLRVSARTSSFKFRGETRDATEIGTQLKVRSILEGSVRKAGTRLRITAQLINVNDGFHLWSERYDRDTDDVFAVQDDIARTVVEKLKVQLLGATDAPLVRRPTDNLEAYNLVLQGRYHAIRSTRTGSEKAIECFTEALALEPTFARAQAGIARVQVLRVVVSLAAPHSVMPEAKEAALKALALDETMADAHEALGYVLQWYEWDWEGAEREYCRALELNPGDVQTRSVYAWLLAMLGRADESLAEMRSAVERDPVSAPCRYGLAMVFVTARRYEEAIAAVRACIELDPGFFVSYQVLGRALIGLGRADEAVEACRQYVVADGNSAHSQAWLGWALGLAGHRQEALTILEALERQRNQEYVGGVLLAYVCLGLGDHDQAISWLQHGTEEHDGLMTNIGTHFAFDPIRSDPRFGALLQRMNFPAHG